MTTITPFHRNVFTHIRFWLQKYLNIEPMDNLYLKPDSVLEKQVECLTSDLLNLCKMYRGGQKRVLVFALYFLHRNIETPMFFLDKDIETILSKITDKKLAELIRISEFSP